MSANTTSDLMTNVTDDDTGISYTINYYFAFFIPVLSLLIITGNILIIVAFWKLPSLREKPSEYLILNLSFVDLCTGFTLLYISPLFIVSGYNPLGEIGCRFANASFNITVSASVFTLIAISTDRFLLVLIAYPKYLKWQSTFRIRLTIITCWTLAFLLSAIEHSIWNVAKTLSERAADIDFKIVCLSPPRRLQAYSLYGFFGVYLGPVLIVCILSSAFFFLLWRRIQMNNRIGAASFSTQSTSLQDRQIEPSQNRFNGTDQPANQPKEKRNSRYTKPALSLVVLVSAMALCMLPYSIYIIIIQFFCPKCFMPTLVNTLLLMQSCNAVLDPFLYGMTQRKIKNFYFR